ncbi:hypothetical protein SELMODRAFT_430093 [Selaginella moellendorffii]|uniref:Uncharacterized protein n=1 Tax=Selaginella moellendorffii TaxID=88036 RepID=D8T8B0_SELML|nr:hypothetical protein SELMODRAFT_430093 [Selaginella moellendorffii]
MVVSSVAVLEACGSIRALVWGREIYAKLTSALESWSFEWNNRVFAAFVKMYGQLGCVNHLWPHDVVSLSVMGCSQANEAVCMVDIFASSIPLAACQVHGDADTGLRVARPVPEWDSDSAAQYVGFSNVCFGCGLAKKKALNQNEGGEHSMC